MKLTLPLFGGLLLVASACGGGDSGPTANRPSIVRELRVQADYGQIYIYDAETEMEDSLDDGPLLRALDDGTNSRRFVGYDSGLIDVQTPSQYNWEAPMRIEVSDEPPPLDADAWDHVVEVPLPMPSGTLVFQASGGGTPIETRIPPGTYRARFSGRGYDRGYIAGPGEIEGHESYRLQLWPAEESEPVLVKYWDGWDVIQPRQ
jgi:hypothetical protein